MEGSLVGKVSTGAAKVSLVISVNRSVSTVWVEKCCVTVKSEVERLSNLVTAKSTTHASRLIGRAGGGAVRRAKPSSKMLKGGEPPSQSSLGLDWRPRQI